MSLCTLCTDVLVEIFGFLSLEVLYKIEPQRICRNIAYAFNVFEERHRQTQRVKLWKKITNGGNQNCQDSSNSVIRN